MTQREFYNAIVNGTINDDVINHATEELAKMDAANEKRRNTPSKKALENAPIVDQIVGLLTAEPKTASDITNELGGEYKVQKVSALLRMAVASGKAVASDVKVPGKGVCKAYALAE